ncbi:MAG: hypothetical protein WKG00_12505 [Polyangiaceae bacterium]
MAPKILGTTRRWLQKKGIAAPPRVFAGMGFDAQPADLVPRAQGRWQEDMTRRNFGTWLEVTATELRVTAHHATPDPVWPDRTWTTTLGAVRVDKRDAFVIEGAGIEVASGHPDSSPQRRTYLLLPTSHDVLWIGTPTPGQQPRWTKLHRVAVTDGSTASAGRLVSIRTRRGHPRAIHATRSPMRSFWFPALHCIAIACATLSCASAPPAAPQPRPQP